MSRIEYWLCVFSGAVVAVHIASYDFKCVQAVQHSNKSVHIDFSRVGMNNE